MPQDYTSYNHHIKNPHAFLDALDSPSLLIQANQKKVLTANQQACKLFGKDLSQIEGRRGGQVIDCLHAHKDDGVCKDTNCQNCKLRDTIEKTFATAQSHDGVQTLLDVKKKNKIQPYFMQVSTEKIGDLVLVIVDKYKKIG